MSRFADLSNDRNEVMMELLKSQNICKALYYNESNFIDLADVEDPESLVYTRIFPYFRLPDAQTEVGTYILFSLRDFQPVRNKRVFKSGLICFYVVLHKDLIRTDFGILRSDLLLSEIDNIMNGKDIVGKVGKSEFVEMGDFDTRNEQFIGYLISYRLYEWN